MLIGLQPVVSRGSFPIFWIGVIFDTFRVSGKVLLLIIWFVSLRSCGSISGCSPFIVLTEMVSYPELREEFIAFIISLRSCIVRVLKFNCSFGVCITLW